MPLTFGTLSARPSIIAPFRDVRMPGIPADAGIKFGTYLSTFFDRQAVLDQLTPAETEILSKFGAFVRQRAMTSIRKANKKGTPSSPGTPPRSHDKYTKGGGRAEHLLRKLMFFGYDRSTRSTVIGPAVINKPTGAPGLCEFGGTVSRPKASGRFVTVTYPKRPYMRPALEREKPKFPQLFSGMLNGRTDVRGS